MKIQSSGDQKKIHISISGSINQTGAEELKKHLNGLNLEHTTEVVIDFAKVSYIGSAGVGKFLLLYKNLVIDDARIFSTAFYLPCQAEGGDHFFLRTLTTDDDVPLQKTIVSLKDQSGHQVGCILRSVITDENCDGHLNGGSRNFFIEPFFRI